MLYPKNLPCPYETGVNVTILEQSPATENHNIDFFQLFEGLAKTVLEAGPYPEGK